MYYGMWWDDANHLADQYYKKKMFTELYPHGSSQYYSIDGAGFEIYGGESDAKYLTVVNKGEGSASLSLQIVDVAATTIRDLETGQTYNIVGDVVSLSFTGFETRFFVVEEVGGGTTYQDLVISIGRFVSGTDSFGTFVSIANGWVTQ